MQAAAARNRPAARKVSRTFAGMTAAAVVLYSALAGWSWFLNPLASLVGQAYTIQGLVVLSIVAAGFNGAAFSPRMELIGGGRETALFRSEVVTNVIQLTVATGAAALSSAVTNLGIFARPIAFAALGVSRNFLYERALDEHYDTDRVATAPATSGATS